MLDYALTTAVTPEMLHPVFEAAVRGTCTGDYTPRQVDAWVGKGSLVRWQELFAGGLHFIAAICVHGGAVAGFTSAKPDGYVHSLFVHPAHQHRGVAALLLRAAEDFARGHGAARLYTEASITARPCFERQGFACVCRQTVSVDGVEMDNFVMSKPLVYAVPFPCQPR